MPPQASDKLTISVSAWGFLHSLHVCNSNLVQTLPILKMRETYIAKIRETCMSAFFVERLQGNNLCTCTKRFYFCCSLEKIMTLSLFKGLLWRQKPIELVTQTKPLQFSSLYWCLSRLLFPEAFLAIVVLFFKSNLYVFSDTIITDHWIKQASLKLLNWKRMLFEHSKNYWNLKPFSWKDYFRFCSYGCRFLESRAHYVYLMQKADTKDWEVLNVEIYRRKCKTANVFKGKIILGVLAHIKKVEWIIAI